MLEELNLIGPQKTLQWVLQFWPVLVVSFIAALVATWLCKKIALKYGIVDKPDDTVKTHQIPIAYLGGVGILFGLIAGILAGIAYFQSEQFISIFQIFFAILAGGAIACFVGLTDDILDIRPWQKILGQTAAAALLILSGVLP
ncbi:MAG: hypothetical protein WC962_07220, partial [Phycisphaerae bacterium]